MWRPTSTYSSTATTPTTLSAAARLVETLLSGPYDQVTGVSSAGQRVGVPSRSFDRQPHVQRARVTPLRHSGHRHAQRISRLLTPVSSSRSPPHPAGSRSRTELTVHSVNLRVPQAEIPVGFKDRGEGWREQAPHLPMTGLASSGSSSPSSVTNGRCSSTDCSRACFSRPSLVLGLPVVARVRRDGARPALSHRRPGVVVRYPRDARSLHGVGARRTPTYPAGVGATVLPGPARRSGSGDDVTRRDPG